MSNNNPPPLYDIHFQAERQQSAAFSNAVVSSEKISKAVEETLRKLGLQPIVSQVGSIADSVPVATMKVDGEMVNITEIVRGFKKNRELEEINRFDNTVKEEDHGQEELPVTA